MATKKPKGAIGKLADFTTDGVVDYASIPPNSHVCGRCAYIFPDDVTYAAHICDTGFRADSIEHQDAMTDGGYSRVSANAQKRGADQ